ncbi:MAG: hypothetical protein ACE5FG_05000 [Myxococcota bacterium]
MTKEILVGIVGVLALALASPAGAGALSGTITLRFDGAGPNKSGTVSFDLPRKVRIGGQISSLPDPSLQGSHTCFIDASLTGSTGRIDALIRLQRGKRTGRVFRASLTDGLSTSLFLGGCDGTPGNGDAFEGDLFSSSFAEPFVWAAQALAADDFNPGTTVEQEIRDFFGIGAGTGEVSIKIFEGHGINFLNPGGSAAGVGSAQVRVKLR